MWFDFTLTSYVCVWPMIFNEFKKKSGLKNRLLNAVIEMIYASIYWSNEIDSINKVKQKKM